MTGEIDVASRWEQLTGKGKKRVTSLEDEAQVNESTDAENEDDAPQSTQSAESNDEATHTPDEDNDGFEDNENTGDKGDINWQKRYNDIRRYVSELKEEMKELKQTLSDKASNPPAPTLPNELPASKEAILKLKSDNPSLYNAIREVINDEVSQDLTELKKTQAQIELEKSMVKVKQVHPDAAEIQKSPEFFKWYSAQTTKVKALFEEGSTVEDWILGLDHFKKVTNKVDTKQQQKDAVKTTSTSSKTQATPQNNNGKKVWTESEIDKLNNKQFAELEKEIDKAFAEGRVILDISKRA